MGGRRAGNHGRVGPYTLFERLGRGGMGEVYLAGSRRGERVALKLLRGPIEDDPEARLRLDREVRALRRVESPYVAKVLDADLSGDRPYLVMDYIEGVTLLDTVRKGGPLAGAGLFDVAQGLAAALAIIHAAGVVHRDLKPANVLMSGQGPVLIDFGIAHVVDATRVTMTGTFLGTPGYAAPELFAGEPVGEPADIHAWAATVAFAATGRPTFGRGTAEAQMYAILHGEADLAGVPAALLPLVRAALNREPPKRPTAALLAGRLARLVRSSADRTEHAERLERLERLERAERMERAEQTERADHTERAERGDKPERGDRADRTERADRIDRGDRVDRVDRGEPRVRRRTQVAIREAVPEAAPAGSAALIVLGMFAVPGVVVSVIWPPATFAITAGLGVLARAAWSTHWLIRKRRERLRGLFRVISFPLTLASALISAVVWPGIPAAAAATLTLWLASGMRLEHEWWTHPGPVTLAGVVFGIVCGGIFGLEVERVGARMPGLRKEGLRALAVLGGFVALCTAAVRGFSLFL